MTVLTDVDQHLKSIKPRLQEEYNIKKIGYFGSYARGDQTAESDIDILVEFAKPIGLKIVELKEYLEETLGKDVDLVTVNAIRPQFKEVVLNEVIYL